MKIRLGELKGLIKEIAAGGSVDVEQAIKASKELHMSGSPAANEIPYVPVARKNVEPVLWNVADDEGLELEFQLLTGKHVMSNYKYQVIAFDPSDHNRTVWKIYIDA